MRSSSINQYTSTALLPRDSVSLVDFIRIAGAGAKNIIDIGVKRRDCF